MRRKAQMWAIGGMRVAVGSVEFLGATGVATQKTPRTQEPDG